MRWDVGLAYDLISVDRTRSDPPLLSTAVLARSGPKKMFQVIADRHGLSLEFSSHRDLLSAISFTHAVALHGCAGSVTLHPERVQLNVGSEAGCYERVRIFTGRGTLAAAMILCSDGRVGWIEALHP
jgi:hypothetical protein